MLINYLFFVAEEARELMAELARETASPGEELVAREYVPLERLGGTPGGCPVCTEFRIFIADGEVLAAGFYWDPADCERAPPPPEEIPPEFVRAALDRLEENGCPLRYYALDVARCTLDGRFTGQDVRAAIAGHVLAEARLTGTYSLNPEVA